MAHPCPASPRLPTLKRHRKARVNNFLLDPVDAIELAKILDYFMERLDILAEHDLAKLLFADCSPYGIDDL